MPATINGIGTSVCKASSDVGWNSYDALECFVILYMPVVPYSALHTFDWNGNRYRSVPLRWSLGLVMRMYMRCWRWPVLIGGIAAFIIGLVHVNSFAGVLGVLFGVLLILIFVLLTLLLMILERRSQQIRRVLGPHVFGSSDPAALGDKPLEHLAGNPKILYGVDSFAEAVHRLLDAGQYSQAMWAARLATALEDEVEGEALTDEVLHHPDVVSALHEVRSNPGRWKQVMLTKEEREARRRQEGN